jgi:2-oxoglutarate dehydrogenase E2 component (dihydrolipoamide succinyltransferase)
MSVEIRVPVLPESVADAVVSTWHKQVGDHVMREENLVDVETDKVMLEVPAPVSGVITAIKAAPGTTVTAQQVLAIIDETAEKAVSAADKSMPAAQAVVNESKDKTAPLSPSVRRAVADAQIDPTQVLGTGKGGRLTKSDVLKASDAGAKSGRRLEERVPMTRLRQKVAERLVAAQHNAAMLTTFNEVNMQAVMDLRQDYKDRFEKTHGIKLGFSSFFIKAVVEALKRFPAVNASIDGTDIIYHGYYDIGMAVSTDRGLVVPVIRDADERSMADLERCVAEYAEQARHNKLTVEDMTGGTFTITNGGVFGSLMSTPILNPPQVAILGMHKIEKRPMVENDQVVIRPMMYVALSYDHRIIDGKQSVQFLATIKELIEDPARLLLGV